jgi:hypothetical protein
MWNDVSDAAKPPSGTVEARHDMHGISGSATTTAEQSPGIEGPSDLRHDAFISYSHQDREFALRLRTALQERGKDVWLDESGIHPAERWKSALQRAIEGPDTFIFVISAYSRREASPAACHDRAHRFDRAPFSSPARLGMRSYHRV